MSYRAAVLADNPVAYWRLDETSGDAIDLIGGEHAVYTGTPTQGVAGLLTGDDNKAVTLNDTPAKTGPIGTEFGGQSALTVECIVKMPTVASGKCFISLTTGATDPFVLFTDSGTDLFLQIHTVDGTQNCGVAGQFSANGRYHIVGRLTGGSATLWVNGVKVKTQAITGGPVTAPAAMDRVWIGKATFGYPMIGTEDEVAVYDYALSDDRIAAHVLEMQTPTEDNNDIFDQANPFLDESGEFVPSGLIG